MSNKEVFVVGHKNPDTDSICSSLGYTYLKNALSNGEAKYISKRAGSLSEETKFVIDYWNVEKPELLTDVRPQLCDASLRIPKTVCKDTTISETWNIMQEEEIESLPVLENGKVIGIITLGDLARKVFNVVNIDCSLASEVIGRKIEGIYTKKEEILSFKLTSFVEDVKEEISNVRYRYFPVEDENGDFAGLVSKGDLLKVGQKNIILMDHAEKTQAVDGIDTACVLEIIDHHRLGGMTTAAPLFARIQPVGCSCTIVYQMYKEKNVEIPKHIAGLLMSAITSDTLLFRSPTCTEDDKRAALDLALIAGVDIEEYAKEMFKAGSNLSDKTAEEIFFMDFKKFDMSGKIVGVGQISTVNSEEIDDLHKKISSIINGILETKGLEYAFFMITDIMKESTKLVCAGKNAVSLLAKEFNVTDIDGDSIYLEGVVSRKKQMIPAITGALK